MTVSFVDVIKPTDNEMPEPEVIIREHFFGCIPLNETTGVFIAETFV